MTKKYEFTVLIEKDEDGWLVGKVPDLQGCATQAKTMNELMKRVREAILACLESEKQEPQHLELIGVQKLEINA
ncbi:MAG: type II toxin-antitoxin system HicB family antitoxin [DPANN group archaeon]|nr:type II toxin-antitoxin system HicB family antitoxin [DPANN group archaeon]